MMEKAAIEYLKKKGYTVTKKETIDKDFRIARFGVKQAIRHLEDNTVADVDPFTGRSFVMLSKWWYDEIVETLKYCDENLEHLSNEL